jgi:hypothetical protein
MTNATKRAILRWIHIIFRIPILGYIYGPVSEVQQYAAAVRFVFVPVIVPSGFWMYSGVFFGIIGVCDMARCISPVWIWGGCPESGRAIHHAEDLVGDSCATFKAIGAIHAVQPTAARCAVSRAELWSLGQSK